MVYDVPADVPKSKQALFKKNIDLISHKKDFCLLFAADQKIEHLNEDFYGTGIVPEANHPEHIFEIAAHTNVGALATQLGLIARYGKNYPHVNYVVKLNSKTHIVPVEHDDPISRQLWSVNDVINFKKNSGLSICGIGYTIYIGSTYESIMFAEAAQAIYQAHQAGLVAFIWAYPRGKSVVKSKCLLAGATGIANALGADFVKVAITQETTTQEIQEAVAAAGNTKIVTAGGTQISTPQLIKNLREQLKLGIAGFAIGRNLFQRSAQDAIKLAHDIEKLFG